ncbi:uncharacterized protein LOC128224515 isoform X1 [Mya arenaria]|uniref:uncharacterized protein LOC128224515 isoform X1 n=1 Tax=Mya arenaria TaxID=6604 RepID=UPI0022E1A43E|nr:uncharacterized protein LOC128224515 isoform X1 [Mya arenaria]
MDVDHEDIDEDIEQLNKVLQDEDDEEGEESEGELRSMELDGESYTDRDGSRPSTSTDVTSSFPTTSICTDPDDMSVRFDSSTINAESCLAMNRAYQEVLLDTLRQIEMSLAENRTKQSKLQQEVKDASRSSNYEKKMAGKGKRCTEQNIPYFRDKDGFYPPANEDVKIKQTLKEDKTYVKAKPGWSKTQRQTLISAVKEDAIQQLVRPLLSKLEVESEKANKCKNKEEIDASKTRIQHLYDEVNKKQKLSGKELLKLFDPDKIDFMKISATNMKGKYDATECEKMWRTVLQPGINKEKWSEDEDKKLEELVEKHNMRDWKAIAEELGTNRTPYQCLQHYQEEHFDYDQSPWTEAEDELLKEVVETCRYGSGVIPWPQVAYYIERRSTKMCEMRWSKVDPSLTHGRWTEAEDMALLAAVQLMGNACDWNVIKDFVPGRNAMQCRERFLKSLDSSVNFDHFTYTEDRIVLQSYNDLGAEWATIAGRLKGRTDCMVQTRHKRLMKWKAMYEEFMKLHKPLQRKILHPAFYIDKHNTIQLRNLPGFKKATPRTLISNTTKRRYKQTDEGAKNKQTDKGSKDLIGEARKLVEMGTEGYEEMKDAEDIKEEADDEYIKEEIVKEEEESVANEEIKALKQELQAFVDRTGIKVNDYAKLNRDIAEGGNSTVVWRPPPLSLSSERYFRQMVDKFSQLQVLVKRQALKEINKLYDSKEDLSAEDAQHLKVLGEMFSQDAADKGRLDQFTDRLYNLFGERLPAKMTVRELLDIARSKKLGIKRSQYIQDDDDPDLINDDEEEEEEKEEKEEDEDEDFDDIEAQELKEEELASLTKQPWEESDSEDEKRRKRRRVQDMESDSSDEEYFTKLEKEVQKREKERKLKAARRNYRGWSDEQKFKMKNAMSQHGELNRKIKAIIKRKMNQTGPGRKKKYIMYPMKIINQDKERTPEEWKKIDRKSFASFTKSLDVDSKVVFNKAYHTRRKITAMAMLKPMEKIKRTRSQSRQVPKIMGVLKEECNAADTLMDCQQELNIADEDLDGSSADSTAEQSTSTEPTNYDRSLPYIPPNKTTLLGMRQLLYEHKALIDNSKAYFNPQELKMQLYKLKTNGPNPLMNVLLAAGKDMEKNRAKTSVEQPSRKMKSSSQHVGQCQQTMREVRQTHDYQKLKARFQAVFTWPALMSTVAIPKVRTFPPAIIEKLKEPSYTEIFEEDPEMKEEPEDDDLTADADDVIPENAEDELDKNLPEIEAIEKLVEKIMEEYARTRSTRRKRIERKRPLKKNSNQKMGQQQRMKTMILRRLGLYERMKELQQAKVKSNSSNPKAGPSIDRTYKPHMRKTSLNSITDRTRTTRSKGGVDDDTSEKSQTEPADIKEMQTNPCEKSAGSAEGVNKSNDLQRPTEDVVEDMAIDDQVDDVNDDISECQTDKALELINGNAQKVISGSSQIAENIVPDSDLNSKVPQSIEESKTVADPEQLDITQTVEKECQNEVHQLKASDTTVKESKESQKIVNESITSQNNVNELNVSQIRICNPNTSKNESEDHEMDEEINKQHTAEEGCQANFEDSDDDDVTPQEKSTRSTEPLVEEVPKRRPGRQKGTKLKCYTPKESARKSSRHPVIPPTSDSKEAKKDGQDPAVKVCPVFSYRVLLKLDIGIYHSIFLW